MACKGKLVLVTVGTTKFDALIKGVDTLTLLSCLHAHGYSELLVQQGKGTYRISNIFPSPVPEVNVQYVSSWPPDVLLLRRKHGRGGCMKNCMRLSFAGIAACICRVEDYLTNLADIIAKASLVITHAGAGSIFESLTYQVPVIVVPNPVLMDNHQVELAKLMEDRNHAVQLFIRFYPPCTFITHVDIVLNCLCVSGQLYSRHSGRCCAPNLGAQVGSVPRWQCTSNCTGN